MSASNPPSARQTAPLLLVFFLSGFAGLVYEVLWLRDLSLLFGSATQSAATTLAVFFLGLSAGSAVWGRRSGRVANPMREYALLEVGIALSACAYFLLMPAYHALYSSVYEPLHTTPMLLSAAKALLATGVLFPAAFFMGGTLPLVGQHLIRRPAELGERGALLYAVNTIGGACGALAAGFYLPAWLGFRASYAAAIVLNLLLAAAAWWLGREAAPAPESADTKVPRREGETQAGSALPSRILAGVAFVSGFTAIGLEVLWTRMFAQVLHNSVYSFAAILVVFLVSLGIGAALASFLARRVREPVHALMGLLIGAGIGVGLSPFFFYVATNGLNYLAALDDWSSYMVTVFGTLAGVCLVPGALVGAVLPSLLRLARGEGGAGAVLGRLASINTAAGVVGSLVVGFLLLDALGLWASLRSLAVVYFLTAIVIGGVSQSAPAFLRATPVVALLLLASFLDPGRLPILPEFDHLKQKPRLLRAWEGRDGTVAVVMTGRDLRITMDTYYSLGGTRVAQHEQAQGDLPLLLHPNPRSAFFLGMGTGITAGAALNHPVERVVTAELSENVVEAAREFFGPYTNGLFTDERSEVVVEDGRNYLKGRTERYDVIIADLFVPWRAGAGSLFTREHYETVRERLEPGGLFAQWLPLYQLTSRDVELILRTILDVFPHATLWRGGFSADRPVLAIIAQAEPTPLDADRLADRFRERRQSPELTRSKAVGLTAMFYAGNLDSLRPDLEGVPVNTDDRPRLEYESPIHQRRQRSGEASFLVGADLARWFADLARRAPPEEDPYLADFEPEEIDYVKAGGSLFEAGVLARAGEADRARAAFDRFSELVPQEIADRFRSAAKPKEPGSRQVQRQPGEGEDT